MTPQATLRGDAPYRPPRGRILVAHLLVVGAFVVLAIAVWHRREVDTQRQRFREQHGSIDIPEAIYFDSLAASVQIPALLTWLGLQLASAVLFCFNRKEAAWPALLTFWTLWGVALLGIMMECGFGV